jgi:hypothetical protein
VTVGCCRKRRSIILALVVVVGLDSELEVPEISVNKVRDPPSFLALRCGGVGVGAGDLLSQRLTPVSCPFVSDAQRRAAGPPSSRM